MATPTLVFTPNPETPSTTGDVTGTNFPNLKTRLLLDGQGATTNIFRPGKDGSFHVGITVGATEKTQVLTAEQQANSTAKWVRVGSPLSIVVKKTVTPPPPPPPPVGPVITAGPSESAVASDSATIGWTLSEPCTGQIEYGLTTAYGQSSLAETSFDYSSHVQTLTGLLPGKAYHYHVKGKDAAGLAYVSADHVFTTTSVVVDPPPPPPPPIGTRRFRLPNVTQTFTAPSSIDATGTQDVTAALTAFINGCPNGSRIVLPAGARYKLAGGAINIRDGMSECIIESDAANPALLLTFGWEIRGSAFVIGWGAGNCSHITFRNISHLGDNAGAGTPNAFVAGKESSEFLAMYHENSYIEVDSIKTERTWGHGIYLGTNGNAAESNRYFWCHDSKVGLTGLYGIVIAKVDTAWVERNYVYDIGGSPLGFEDGSGGDLITHVYYGDNILDRWMYALWPTGHCIVGDGANGAIWDDVWVNKNVLKGGPQQPRQNGNAGDISFWSPEPKKNIRVTDNDMSALSSAICPNPSVRLWNVTGGQVTGNKFPVGAGQISLAGCSGIVTTPNP